MSFPFGIFAALFYGNLLSQKIYNFKFELKFVAAFPEDQYLVELQFPNLRQTSERRRNQPDLPLASADDDVQPFTDSETLRQLLPDEPARTFLRSFRRR